MCNAAIPPIPTQKPIKKRKLHVTSRDHVPIYLFIHQTFVRLHSGILTLDSAQLSIGLPCGTGAVEGIVVHESWDLGHTLDQLEGKSLRCVPTDVAVHQPSSWVVGLESNDQVTGSWKHGDITSWRVGGGESSGGRVSSGILCEDIEVVTVEMDWMWDGLGSLDDEVDPFIGSVELNDVGVGGVAGVSLVDLEKSWVGPFDFEGGTGHVPFEQVVGSSDSDSEVVGLILIGSVHGVVWNKVGHVFV